MGSHTLIKVRDPLIEHNSIYYLINFDMFLFKPILFKKDSLTNPMAPIGISHIS